MNCVIYCFIISYFIITSFSPSAAMVWTLNDKRQNFSFGSFVRKNILPRVMLVKNIVKSTFFLLLPSFTVQYYFIILLCFAKKVCLSSITEKLSLLRTKEVLLLGKGFSQELQDSRPKTFWVQKRLYFKDIFTQDQQVSKTATFGAHPLESGL